MRTYGTMTLEEDMWVIQAEPHVAMKLKAVCGKLAKQSYSGEMRLSSSPENAFDLEWFLQRYPMEVDEPEILREQAGRHREVVQQCEQLLAGTYTPRVFPLAIPLRDYQARATEVLLKRGQLVVGDDLGLGKSAIGIGAMTDGNALPALVVTLTNLTKQWEGYVHDFAPHLITHVLKKGTPYPLPQFMGRTPDVIICNYHKLDGWARTLGDYVRYVVFDECLSADTAIRMENGGSRFITDMEPGDTVSAFDAEGNIVQDRVVAVVEKGVRQVWKVTLEDGRSITCTSNERIFTNKGWVFLQEIIDASCPQNQNLAVNTGHWIFATDDSWDTLGRRQHVMGARAYPWSISLCSRRETGRVLHSQSGSAAGLCQNQSANCCESRVGQAELCIQYGHQSCFRVYSGHVLSSRHRGEIGEDGDARVGCELEMGSGCILVHGRRDLIERQSDCLLYAQFSSGTSGDSPPQIVGDGRRWSDRFNQEEGVSLLYDQASSRKLDSSYEEDTSVLGPLHELQVAVHPYREIHVPILRSRMRHRQQEGSILVVHEPRMPTQEATCLVGAQKEKLQFTGIVSIEKTDSEPVYDLETERYHSFFANGIAVHNCQELRRRESLKYKAARHISERCRYRAGLSATPIMNYGGEFWNVCDVICPGQLGTHDEFVREWCSHGFTMKPRITDPKAFGTYLRENFIFLRRTRKEVGRELPPVIRISHTIDSDARELHKIKDSAGELARIILRRIESTKEQRFTAGGQFDMLMRQATGIAKAPYVADFVRLLCESGEKVILAGWHREVYSLWASRLKDLNPVYYTGSESANQKEASKRAFIDGNAQVVFMSLRAGVGVEGFQKACSTVVFGELDWSPGIHDQVVGRLHRDGVDGHVTAYYLIAEDGSDPIVADVLGVKREQVEGIRNPDAPLIERLDRGEHNIKRLAEAFLGQRK